MVIAAPKANSLIDIFSDRYWFLVPDKTSDWQHSMGLRRSHQPLVSRHWVFVFFAICSLIASHGDGEEFTDLANIDLAGVNNGRSTGDRYQYLEEAGQALSLAEVVASPDWRTAQANTEARGLMTHGIWMRFILHNSTNSKLDLILEYRDPASYSLDFYHRLVSQAETPFAHLKSRYHDAVSDRAIPFLRPAFPLTVRPGEHHEIYLRAFAGNDFPNQVYTSLRLWERKNFDRSAHIELTLVAAVFSLQLIMSFATLVAFIMTKERLFFFYALFSFTGASALTSSSGHLWYFLAQEGYQQWMTLLQVCVFQVAVFLFVRTFMGIKRFSITLDRMLLGMIWIEIISVVATLVELRGLARSIADLTAISYLLFIPLGLYAWKKGVKYAGLFTASWFVFITGSLTFTLTNFGYLQLLPLGHITIYYGFFIEFALLGSIMALRLRDIAQQKNALEKAKVEKEREVVAAQKQVIQAHESSSILKNDFISSISHELRTPMNAIVGGLQLAQLQQSQHAQSPLRLIQRGADEMMVLVNDILTHGEILANKLSTHSLAIAVAPRLQQLELQYQEKCDAKNLELKWSIDPALPTWISIDEDKLIIIFSKLLDNALKFTEKGHIRFVVKCDNKADPRQLHCFIEDTGIGITPNKAEYIFDAFTQSDTGFQRRYPGLGIGLSICKQLTHIIGGSIELTSQVGEGSRFSVDIPFEKSAAPNKIETHQRASASLPIMVVEDNVVNQTVIIKLLEKLGYKSLVAAHGEEAIQLLDKHSFSLILMDLQMPVLDGFSCTGKIRSRKDELAKIPIIAVTANLMDADKKRCIKIGMNDFLIKPVNLRLLKKTIENHIEPGIISPQ